MKQDVQLLRWSETSSGGFTITLLCSDDDQAREYFRNKTLRKGKQAGQLFAMALDELDEHGNEPKPVPQRFAGGPICKWLVMRCDDPLFQEWSETANKHAAEVWQKRILQVDSRKEIDGNRELEGRFVDRIRVPYMRWIEQQQAIEPQKVAA